MDISRITQVEYGTLSEQRFDAIIGASGYESRASHVPLQLPNARRKIAIGFSDREDIGARRANDERYLSNGFDLVAGAGSDQAAIVEIVHKVVQSAEHDSLRIVIDYTSMTRVWYAGALRALADMRPTRNAEVTVYFTYTPSVFIEPMPARPNRHAGPIPGFSSLGLPSDNVALVLGLGYERDRGIGLVEFVEPAETVAFVADPALDSRFVNAAKRNNASLLARIPEAMIISYPFADMTTTAHLLASVCRPLSTTHRVIVAPLGPKPFAMLALLLSLRVPGVDVWRVSAGAGGSAYDRRPFREGYALALSVQFRPG